MDKAIAFRKDAQGDTPPATFYFERITTRLDRVSGIRKVVCVGFMASGMDRVTLSPDVLFDPNGPWKYAGPRTWEG